MLNSCKPEEVGHMEGADVACDVPTVGGVKVLEILDKRFDEDGRDHDDYDHDGHWS